MDNPVVDRRARIAGCMLGGAVGDALGAPVEFLPLSTIRSRFGPEGLLEYVPAYGRLGAITDDTQMSLFTAEGLINTAIAGEPLAASARPVHVAYLCWLRTQGDAKPVLAAEIQGWLLSRAELWSRRSPGNTCVTALHAALRCGEAAQNDSKGCGTIMRVAPVGLVLGPSLRENEFPAYALGRDVSALTHGHPTASIAGGYFAELVSRLSHGHALEAAIAEARAPLSAEDRAGEVSAAIDRAVALARTRPEGTPEDVETLGGGWTAEEALSIALYCALVARDFAHGVRLAVNHSGDSDSTGALTGNLLGARWGRGAIPERLLSSLELVDLVEEIAGYLADLVDGRLDPEVIRRKHRR